MAVRESFDFITVTISWTTYQVSHLVVSWFTGEKLKRRTIKRLATTHPSIHRASMEVIVVLQISNTIYFRGNKYLQALLTLAPKPVAPSEALGTETDYSWIQRLKYCQWEHGSNAGNRGLNLSSHYGTITIHRSPYLSSRKNNVVYTIPTTWNFFALRFRSTSPNELLKPPCKCSLISLRIWEKYGKNNVDRLNFTNYVINSITIDVNELRNTNNVTICHILRCASRTLLTRGTWKAIELWRFSETSFVFWNLETISIPQLV